MKALILNKNRQIELKTDVQLPKPEAGEVVIQVHYAPINPSDLLFLKGHYNTAYLQKTKPLPTIPGFEGSGVVISEGKRFKKGTNVCFLASTDSYYGSWGEFTVVNEENCIDVGDLSLDQAACGFVNPLCVLYMLNIALKAKAKYVIQTAAASQLGRMFIRLAKQYNIGTVNIVRSSKIQEQLSTQEEAKYVLNSSNPHFENELQQLCESKDIHLAFDSIGGSMTKILAKNIQPNSEIYVIGALEPKPCQIQQSDLIFRNIVIKGLWVYKWMKTAGHYDFIENLPNLLKKQLRSEIKSKILPEQANEAFDQYQANMSSGKVLLSFNQTKAKL